jgi:hypothetical protein
MDWRELHLTRRSRAFNFAHRWLKVAAIVIGFPATTISLMALASRFTGSFNARAGVAVAIALAVPGLVAWLALPRHDPLVAVGLPSETYALVLLGFGVLFVVALHEYTGPLLIREGDRALCAGMREVARAAWVLGGEKPSQSRARPAAPCGPRASR